MRFAFFLFLCSITIAATAQDSAQAQLLGKYKFPDGSVVADVVVAFENGGLTMSSSAGISVLEQLKKDSFSIVSFNGTAVFKRNDAGKVTGVHIEASGYVLDGVKDAATAGSADSKGMEQRDAVADQLKGTAKPSTALMASLCCTRRSVPGDSSGPPL